jgi:hypothetical protein
LGDFQSFQFFEFSFDTACNWLLRRRSNAILEIVDSNLDLNRRNSLMEKPKNCGMLPKQEPTHRKIRNLHLIHVFQSATQRFEGFYKNYVITDINKIVRQIGELIFYTFLDLVIVIMLSWWNT